MGLNSAACGFDGGDCCECDCKDGAFSCGISGFNCIDPDSDCAVPTTDDSFSLSFSFQEDDDVPTTDDSLSFNFEEDDDDLSSTEFFSFSFSFGDDDEVDNPFPYCESNLSKIAEGNVTIGTLSMIGDGRCDFEAGLNTRACGYDGGDCCVCDCEDEAYECGVVGFFCADPSSNSSCIDGLKNGTSTTTATSTTTSTTEDDTSTSISNRYPNCTGNLAYIGDGYCDLKDLNTAECGYDGGDCCYCECQDGDEYECDDTPFNCIDPAATTDCVESCSNGVPCGSFGGENYTAEDCCVNNILQGGNTCNATGIAPCIVIDG
ncbi:unnamed protein product [Pylaiella littoralis]